MVRPLIMRKYGGVYLDLDILPTDISIASLLQFAATSKSGIKRCILFGEVDLNRVLAILPAVNRVRNRVPEAHGLRFANYAMASSPNHPFWDHYLQVIKDRLDYVSVLRKPGESVSAYDVLFTTGPDALTHAVNSVMSPANAPTPVVTIPKISRADMADVLILTKPETDSILYHQCSGSWRNAKDA